MLKYFDNGGWYKVIIFVVDNNLSLHIDDRKKQRLNTQLILLSRERKFASVYTIIQPVVFCMLTVKQSINSKQENLK